MNVTNFTRFAQNCNIESLVALYCSTMHVTLSPGAILIVSGVFWSQQRDNFKMASFFLFSRCLAQQIFHKWHHMRAKCHLLMIFIHPHAWCSQSCTVILVYIRFKHIVALCACARYKVIGSVRLSSLCLSSQKSPDLKIQASWWSVSMIKELEVVKTYLLSAS